MGGLSALHLVHGVMRAGGLPPAGLGAAVPGGELAMVEGRGLMALTTRLPEALPCGTAGADLFGDVERTRATALEHHRVLSAIAAEQDIAPVRLGALRAGEASVRDMLDAEAEPLADALSRVSGMVELGLRIVATGAPAAPVAAAPASGRDYLRARSALAHVGRDHEAAVASFVRDACDLVEPLAADRRAVTAASPAGQPRRWLDLALLVARGQVGAVETVVAALQRRAEPLRLAVTLSGPWPAYSFVAKET